MVKISPKAFRGWVEDRSKDNFCLFLSPYALPSHWNSAKNIIPSSICLRFPFNLVLHQCSKQNLLVYFNELHELMQPLSTDL